MFDDSTVAEESTSTIGAQMYFDSTVEDGSTFATEGTTASGARIETFNGLAGVGDLTATMLAPKSRNRRAGELLGRGEATTEQIPGIIGQTSEGLDSVPLIADTLRAKGYQAKALESLAALIRGEITNSAWIQTVRRAGRERSAA